MTLKEGLFGLVASAAAYVTVFWLNAWLLDWMQFSPSIYWVFLPAGVRLAAVLLFDEAGAVGITLATLACERELWAGSTFNIVALSVTSGLAPYIAYRVTQHFTGFARSLGGLTATSLLWCVTLYAVLNSILRNAVLYEAGTLPDLGQSLVAMFVGDLLGALICLYLLKWILSRRRAP